MTSVFISYRRDDTTQGWAAFLHDRLTTGLGVDAFMDVDSLPAGVNWRHRIQQVLAECDVALVLIGRLWLTITDDAGTLRLNDPKDVHRMEITEALRQEWVRVIPVLFAPATMPKREELPEEIQELVDRHGCTWHRDETALSQLRKIEDAVRLGPLGPRPQPGSTDASDTEPPPTPRKPQTGAVLSAHVLALCAELLEEIADEDARRELARIQDTLRQAGAGDVELLADAEHADAALDALEALSYAEPELRIIRDRVEELRDSGPDMQLIELAKWYERSSAGEVELPQPMFEELERLLLAQTPAERLNLNPAASELEVRIAADERVRGWRAFEGSPLASPNAQRVAAEVVRFYEESSTPAGQPGGRFTRA